jgi:hypothetical protein
VFHDTTSGNNSVPGVTGFTAGAGYDLSTGLGSVDAAILVNHWSDGSIVTPSFQLSAPSAASVTKGSNAQVNVQVPVTGGFSGAVSLSVSGLPAGLTASFGPASITAPGSSTLTLTAGSTVTAGTYNLTVSGVNSSTTRTGSIAVTITQPANCTYTVSNNGFRSVSGGYQSTFTVTAPAGCAWTSVTNTSWVTIQTGATGSGNGTSNVFVAAGSRRSGSLTIAGYTYTITEN